MLHWYLIGKPGFFLSWANIDGVGDIYLYQINHSPYLEDWRFSELRAISYYLHWPLMLLGLLGALAACWRPAWLDLAPDAVTPARIVAGTLAYAIVLHMVGAPFPRYGIPFRPLVILLAIAVLARVAGTIGRPDLAARADRAPG